MKKLLTLCLLSVFILSSVAFSQSFEVPAGYSFKAKDDYARYEKDIIAASKWLFATPLNEQTEKRKEVSAFLVQWVSGSPTVNVEITPIILDFEKKNEGMMVLYFAGCSAYVLEHNYSKDMRAKHRATLQAMMDFYKAGNGVKKDKKMEKLIKQTEEGKLDEWIEENIPVRS